ncbi:hypothetical protein LTR54_018168 [Friedmanniomyces endolithicus]|nr:hypothetical protein LTR54_018168 [Friedmanniomyces endolithicus]
MPPDPQGLETERQRKVVISLRLFGWQTVIFAVGQDLEEFTVHEGLLCKQSSYFQSWVKEEWKGESHIIPLPADRPEVVNLYIYWIHAGRIVSRSTSRPNRQGHKELDLLVDSFVFGEKILDGPFKDAVIDAVVHTHKTPDDDETTWCPGVTAINRAYKGTPSDSPLRRLLVDLWARNDSDDWQRKGLNPDFLTALVGELLAHREPRVDLHLADAKTSTCSYHQHGDDDLCYSRRNIV